MARTHGALYFGLRGVSFLTLDRADSLNLRIGGQAVNRLGLSLVLRIYILAIGVPNRRLSTSRLFAQIGDELPHLLTLCLQRFQKDLNGGPEL